MMSSDHLRVAVTGAISYSGRAICAELKSRGHYVRTLTGHPHRHVGDDGPEDIYPLDFTDPAGLRNSLENVSTLINTYWVRYPHGGVTFADVVNNSKALFNAASESGVQRVVHLSITHANTVSPHPYFASKGMVEEQLMAMPMSHAILRPALLFGGRAVLINNIAWLLRHLPVFAIGDHGTYRIRGIHLNDLARLCANEAESDVNTVYDAVGPDRPSFHELISLVRDAVGSRCLLVNVPGALIPICAAGLGVLAGDVLLTRAEYAAMASGLADTDTPATGDITISSWIAENAKWLGRNYIKDSRNTRSPRWPVP